MPLYRVQFEFQNDSGNPLDKYLNTVHIQATTEEILGTTAITAFTTFYGALAGEYSSLIAPAASVYRAYDLADPEPRAPVLEEVWNLGTTSSQTTAPEISIVLSYEAPQQSGEVQARRRGRMYLGPLWSGAISSTTGQLTNGMVDAVTDAAQDLLDASANSSTWSWMVYSRVNEAAVEVLHCWCDNAADIQRRRGLQPTYTVDVTPVFP